MRWMTVCLLAGVLVGLLGGCLHANTTMEVEMDQQGVAEVVRGEGRWDRLVPRPASLEVGDGRFVLGPGARVGVPVGADEEVKRVAGWVAEALALVVGEDVPVVEAERAPEGGVWVAREDEEGLGEEGYVLSVRESGVRLVAPKGAGVFWGLQTLRQLLPPPGEGSGGRWAIPAGTVRDVPRFAWRGVMLDVARHFFGPEDVRRVIDWMVVYKLNRLHLHLSDDQGWRLEIRSWPRLAEVGGSTEVGGGPGGYYTQEEYADLVRYAAERYVMVVPEFDMPGHTNAALASYGELTCDGVAPELYTGTEVGFSSLCVGKEEVWRFVEDVIGEVAALTPGKYVHVGGDEAKSTELADYVRFVERVQEIVEAHGKVMIGWEEVAQASLSPGTVVQYWWDEALARRALRQGNRLILSPAARIYLDMKYDESTRLGLNWAGYTDVRDAYDWEPLEAVRGAKEEDLLGVEAPLWSETVTTLDEVAYMLFPRLIGVAEIGWSPAGTRDWEEYRVRLGAQGPYLRAMGVAFYEAPEVPWE